MKTYIIKSISWIDDNDPWSEWTEIDEIKVETEEEINVYLNKLVEKEVENPYWADFEKSISYEDLGRIVWFGSDAGRRFVAELKES